MSNQKQKKEKDYYFKFCVYADLDLHIVIKH